MILMPLGLKNRPFMPHNLIPVQGSPVPLLKFKMDPRFKFVMSSGSKKKPSYTCFSEAISSHWQRRWAEVPSSALHFLCKGILASLSEDGFLWHYV
jgi:hypothetical protein